MIYKKALLKVQCPIYLNKETNHVNMVKTASGKIIVEPGSDKAKIIEAEIKKHPTALFFRAKAIKADEPNSNGDYFSESELKIAYKSFEGVPFFTNHDNQNVENARGKVIFAEWIPEEKAVYTISFIDREAFPHICRSIEEEYITGVSMGALHGDAIVTMFDLSEKKISDINAGDIVRTAYGNNKRVKMVHNEYLGKPMYSFDLMTFHKTPKFTEDHPIYMLEGALVEANKEEAIKIASSSKYEKRMGYVEESVGQDTWRHKKYDPVFTEANKIKSGDFILVPSKFKLENGSSFNSDFYYVAGAYLGDGYLKKDKKGEYEAISFCFGIDEIELSQKIISILKKYSKAEPNISICSDRNGLYLSLYDRNLAKWFSDNIGSGSKSKRIKFNIKFKEDAINLLAGYLDTDGCIAKKTNISHTNSYQFSSANLPLLEDVQSLLIALDSISRISSFERRPGKNSVVSVDTIEHTLSVGSNSSRLLKKSVKFNNNVCEEAKIKAGKTFIVEANGNKFMACPVKEIFVEEFNEPVYDITVEDDECYIADGIAVHNCSVEYSVCSICENRAEKTEQYCPHIKERKARTFTGRAKNVVTGETKEFKNASVFEYNYGIKFIELSAVVDPACPSCRIQGLINNDDLLKRVANIQNSIYMIKTAALTKEAGQEEIQQLNTVLKTLEDISIKLIQNRQQIEVEFASDLVGILSELQTFVDELVGAGYGNAQSIPGAGQAPQAQAGNVELPAPGLPASVTPVAEESPAVAQPPAPQVGKVTGAPGQAPVQSPKLPITAPAKPRAFDISKMNKVASNLQNINDKIIKNIGEDDMGRLTLSAKMQQKKSATEILSSLWKEKQELLEYINNVPSIQDNEKKLSVKKRDDSFVIVAENKDDNSQEQMVWTFESLSGDEKEMIRTNPKSAATYFLDKFSKNLINKKQGDTVMTNNTKEAGAKSVNKAPDVVQEAQLETSGLYHSRTDKDTNVITEKQLDAKREGEKDVLTEAQLKEKSNKLNPRTEESKEVITEAQLESDGSGASPRKDKPWNEITQSQLDSNNNRVNSDKDVITERQLDSVDAPWERSAKRNSSMFKSAGDHMKEVVNVMADTVISTGCTPDEACAIGSSLIASTKDRFNLGNAILDDSKEEDVDYSKRLAYWSNKNIKVAGVGSKEIASSIIRGLRKVASDTTINPEVIIDALDVVSEGKVGVDAISKKVDKKLQEAASKESIKSSKKEDLRKALLETSEDKSKEVVAKLDKEDKKMTREMERSSWKKISSANKVPDTMIETSFDEVGCKKEDASFKSAIKSFARGALASKNIKLAAITNVTISGDTISIAVQTNEGEEAVEIPVGQNMSPSDIETVPEGDTTGEALEQTVGIAPPPAPAGTEQLSPKTGLPVISKDKNKMTKKAQVGGAGGSIPGAPGASAGGPGAPEAALPGAVPEDQPLESLTTDEAVPEIDEETAEIPTAGTKQPLISICPECGSNNVDVERMADGNAKGVCNDCSAEYEALIKKEVEFKIIKPTKSSGEELSEGAPEAPEVPALPVAAQTNINKDVIVRIAKNKESHGNVCPACGMKHCKASVEGEGHSEYTCPACNTQITKDIIVNVNNPEESMLRVKWDLVPDVERCAGCEEEAKKFASLIKIEKMIKSAASTKFPMANCMERIARKWGGNSSATFGPCKGKPLAECVCKQLEKLGLTKVRHLEKLASAYAQKDPMDECVEDHMKQKFDRKEAETICNCLKKKFATKDDDNIFKIAFSEDIKSGKEKILTAQDLDAMGDMMGDGPSDDIIVEDIDLDIGDPIDDVTDDVTEEVIPAKEEVDTVTIEVSEETAQELADAAKDAVEAKEEIELDGVEPVEDVAVEGEIPPAVSEEIPSDNVDIIQEENDMAIAMKMHKIVRVGEEIVKIAATPTVVDNIEGNVEAKVPRSDAKMGEESKADSLINKQNKGPDVPRKDAYMGKEKAADSLINKELKLPDVAVDSAYMGKEKEVQTGMPAINNDIKGTVIAEKDKTVKEAKKMKEVDTVEPDVDAGVPRSKATIGNEGPDNIDVKENKPNVPRAKATMGEEGSDNIDVNAESPDVPIDSAYMGGEKEVQKDMPGINDKMLKNVQQKKEVQLERIAVARRMKAVETAAKLLATKRIPEEAYENVVEALSRFELDKISSVADSMYPKIKKQASDINSGHSVPAIVMESKQVEEDSFAKKLASHFTIGNQSFDTKLTIYGDK